VRSFKGVARRSEEARIEVEGRTEVEEKVRKYSKLSRSM
jgi:hypothetical protein